MIDTKDTLSENIKFLMQKNNVSSITELARQLKINQPTLHRLLSGEVKDPKYAMLKQIASHFRVSPTDLADKRLQDVNEADTKGASYIDISFNKVPVLGNTQLGAEGLWAETPYSVNCSDGFISWPTKDADAYALKCVGDSMMPRIKEGEFVIVEPNHNYVPGDEVLVVTQEGEAMVKTFLFERDGLFHLMSVNENHPPIRLSRENVEKIHYVAGIAKSALRNY